MLLYAIRNQESLGQLVETNDPALISVTYSFLPDDVHFITIYLEERGFVRFVYNDSIAITGDGYSHYEDLQGRQTASAQGFVAMWFNEEMQDSYSFGFDPGIRAAGYNPIRVDRVEHAGKIDDEIIAQIRKSRFVVADFTGHRGGVYFEAGFALGLGLPVFWTCRDTDLENLHFDIRQFNMILWSEPLDLADRLQKRIEAVIGVGPRKSLDL